MSVLKSFAKMIPYPWRKGILDLVRPERPGIGPVLRGMDRNLRTVFDIGANVGDISSLMLYYFPQATVYSFEPCTSTYDTLVRNIARTGLAERSRTFKLGFFDEEKQADLHITSFHGANSMLEITEEYRALHPHISKIDTEQISLVRLDDFVNANGIEHIDLIKIDVEGVEQQILKGGAATLSSKVDTVIMEMSFLRNPRNSGEYLRLFQIMHDYGFAPARIYDLEHASVQADWPLGQFDCVFKKF
ncbi:hypothetical protein GMLC_37190 [Geomonas limicola]|uniref:Methyltransferase FkbM domain-containing protein n=1 Tax=Geomonas limicola TaxID=2740186 RepID=A0A6V8NCI5_9BACT|nr:FkbM family methyltransferase [Geomonas limicola]GFO70140.1 hypothetical protein GMLC_37190 [Geomonas limicola]